MAQVSYGTITITDTNDIEEIFILYGGSNDNTTSPTYTYAAVTGGTIWKRNVTAITGFKYIWQITVITKSGITINSTNWQQFYGAPVRITGEEGNDATNITSIEVMYGISASWNSEPIGADWSTDVPNYNSAKPNYWTRTRLKYEDNTYSSWVVNKDYALTKAVYDSAMANSISQSANENANGALSIATGVEQHFFWIGKYYSTSVPAGAYMAERGKDEFKANPTGGNLITRTDGIYIRNGANLLSSLTGSALNFYQPPTISGNTVTQGKKTMMLSANALRFYDPSDGTTEQAKLDTNGLVLSKGGIKAGSGNNFIYLSTEGYPLRGEVIDGDTSNGFTINNHTPSVNSSGNDDPAWKQIIGTKFGVDSEGNLYASDVNIKGNITATGGTIANSVLESNQIIMGINDNIGMKITKCEEDNGYDLLSNISMVADKIHLSADNITFGPQNNVGTELSKLVNVVEINTDIQNPYLRIGQARQAGENQFYIKLTNNELGFYQASKRVAYISNDQLYITQSVVLQQMDLGIRINNSGLGQWSWKVHANGQNPSRNNLNLKWVG